jgi:hypothetical protein
MRLRRNNIFVFDFSINCFSKIRKKLKELYYKKLDNATILITAYAGKLLNVAQLRMIATISCNSAFVVSSWHIDKEKRKIN